MEWCGMSVNSGTQELRPMKLHIAVVLVPMFLAGHAIAQTGWGQMPSGATQDLHAIDYNHIVGDSGTLITSADMGLTWAALNSGTTKDLFGIVGCGSGCFYFCGDSGAVSRAIAFGATIEPHDIAGRDLPLWDIAIQGSDQPFVVGDSGYFARSFNFGTLFTVYPTGSDKDLFGISDFGPSYRSAVGAQGTILKSTDLGLTWTAVVSGTTEDLYDVYAQQSVASIAVGDNGTILRSESASAGEAWTPVNGPVTTRLNAVARDGLNGVIMAVGDGGVIIRSVDDGLSWIELVSGTTEDLYDVFPWSGAAWLVAGANGIILRSTDNGGSGVGITEMGADPGALSAAVVNGMVQVSLDVAGALNGQLRMFDMRGREVMEPFPLRAANGYGGMQLPVPGSTGLYTIVAQVDGRQYSTRFLHQVREY